jgi:hypothetical protein
MSSETGQSSTRRRRVLRDVEHDLTTADYYLATAARRLEDIDDVRAAEVRELFEKTLAMRRRVEMEVHGG